MWKYYFILVSIIFSSSTHNVLGDYYTSIADLEYMLDAESFLVERTEEFLHKVEQKNKEIDEFLRNVEHLSTQIDVDTEAYYGNPINAFKTINRLVTHWERFVFLNIETENAIDKYNKSLSRVKELEIFNPAELHGAIRAIARLQDTYALATADLTKGMLNGKKISADFSANECFQIGHILYDLKEYQYAVEWLLRARAILLQNVNAYSAEKVFPHLEDKKILEVLPAALYQTGNFKLANKLNSELLAKDPQNVYAQQNKLIFEKITFDDRNGVEDEDDNDGDDADDVALESQFNQPDTIDLYKRVCRGEAKREPNQERHLRCRYTHNNVAYHYLSPFKLEQQSVEPFVAIYHDAVLDSEITKIMNASKEYLARSQVGDGEQSMYTEIRTSKNTWLEYQKFNLSSMLLRLDHITGLSTQTVEQMQVVNYGIGGHYEPHNDFPSTVIGDAGHRILTALFYINDVELGGGTAFPFLRLAVPPKRGSLLVWYNLHTSSEVDFRMRHAGCPVLKGSKWIANVWFHEAGQEFRRPCGLERDGAKSIKYENL